MSEKKEKGIYDGMDEIQTMPDLLARIGEEYEKRKQETSIQQEATKARLVEAVQMEKEITKKIGAAKKIVEKLQSEFLSLEVKFEKESRKKAEGNFLREKDLRTGKVKLADFLLKGKKDKEIESEIAKNVGSELEAGLKGIKAKNLELLKMELSLFECQHRISSLIIQPGVYMQQILKDLMDFTNVQVNDFVSELSIRRTGLEECKRKLLLVEKGMSLTPGQIWEGRTPKEARKIQFDPIIPLDVVPQLLSELEKWKDADQVVVNFFWRSKTVDVAPYYSESKRKIITTSKLRKKSLITTSNLEKANGQK